MLSSLAGVCMPAAEPMATAAITNASHPKIAFFRLAADQRPARAANVFDRIGAGCSGRGPAITVQKGRRVKLANMATGVQYSLLFMQAGIAAPSTTSNSK